MNKNVLATIVALVTIVGAVFGATQYFAKAADVDLIAKRLENKIIEDRISALQNRIWMFDDRYGPNCRDCSRTEKKEYRHLLHEIQRLKARLRAQQ